MNATLEDNYDRCIGAFGWNEDVLRDVARTSIEASYANADVKAKMRSALAAW